jgi:hypothetical protein
MVPTHHRIIDCTVSRAKGASHCFSAALKRKPKALRGGLDGPAVAADEEGGAQDVAMDGPGFACYELRGQRDTLETDVGDQGIELGLREGGDRHGHRDLRVVDAVEVGRSGRQGLGGGRAGRTRAGAGASAGAFATKEGSRGRSLVAGDGTTGVGHFGGTGGLLGVAAPKPAVGRLKRHHLHFREVADEVCQVCFDRHAAVSVHRSIGRGDCGRGHGAFGEEERASKPEELLGVVTQWRGILWQQGFDANADAGKRKALIAEHMVEGALAEHLV